MNDFEDAVMLLVITVSTCMCDIKCDVTLNMSMMVGINGNFVLGLEKI